MAGPIILAFLLVVAISIAMGIPQQLLSEDLLSDGNGLFSESFAAGSGSWVKSWTFEGDNFTLSFDLSDSEYEYYQSFQIERGFRFSYDYDHGLDFITASDPVVMDIAASLKNLSGQAGLNEIGMANLALSFVQSCFPYTYDNLTYGAQDYWAFPLETLHNGQGDCEDKSFLYASIMVDLGYHAALLYYEAHMAIGVGADYIPSGTYYEVGGVSYYYCETTSPGWTMGQIPQEYGESHVVVVR